MYAEIAPKPPLAQKCFGEIAVVGHHDFDSGSRNTILAYTHCADRKSYLCSFPKKREQRNNEVQTEYVTFLRPFEIDRQFYPKENIFLLVAPKTSWFLAGLRLL